MQPGSGPPGVRQKDGPPKHAKRPRSTTEPLLARAGSVPTAQQAFPKRLPAMVLVMLPEEGDDDEPGEAQQVDASEDESRPLDFPKCATASLPASTVAS